MTTTNFEQNEKLPMDSEKADGAELGRLPTVHDGATSNIILKHADQNDGDEALKAFMGHEGEVIVMTPEMEKKLLRKIDWNLMPVRCLNSAQTNGICGQLVLIL